MGEWFFLGIFSSKCNQNVETARVQLRDEKKKSTALCTRTHSRTADVNQKYIYARSHSYTRVSVYKTNINGKNEQIVNSWKSGFAGRSRHGAPGTVWRHGTGAGEVAGSCVKENGAVVAILSSGESPIHVKTQVCFNATLNVFLIS